MGNRLAKLAIAAAATFSFAGTAQAAPFLSYMFGGHRYDFYLGSLSWGAAQAFAVSQGGYLATLTNSGENNAAFTNVAAPGFDFWLGGAEGAEGVYSWQGPAPEAGLVFWNNGAVPGVYNNFNGGEPNNSGGDQRFLRFNAGNGNSWDDYGPVGGVPSGFLVESAVPEPATWAMMIVGFGIIGFGLRRRRKQSVRVTYA